MDVISLGRTPIADDKPAGKDVRHGDDYEALQAQIDLLSMVSAEGQGIDWEVVEQLSSKILAEQSKNILVAAYLAAALEARHGLPGLADGAGLMRDLTATFWDDMFPPKKRLRGRLNAYAWWQDRALAFLRSYQPDGPQPKELMDGLTAAVTELNDILGEKSDDAPILRDVLELIGRIPVEEPEPEPESEPDQPAPEEGASAESPQKPAPKPAPQAAAAPPPPPADVSSLDEQAAETLHKQAMASLASYGEWLTAKDPRDPLPYRITRWQAWTKVKSLPPAEGAATRLPPPDPQVLQSLEQLLSTSRFEEALKGAESRVPQYLFLIDLSRISAKALEGLGDEWSQALEAVKRETSLYVKRLPGVMDLSFSDGTPFCNEDTKAWLQTLEQGDGSAGPRLDAVDKAAAAARKKAAAKDVIGALGELDTALSNAGRVRDRFRLQTAMLKLLAGTDHPQLAAAYSEDVVAVIDRHRLDAWEPELALDGLAAAYAALKPGAQEGADIPAAATIRETVQDIFSRMSRISPAHALRAAGPAE